MKYVLVSDIHGNAPALEAVVEREGLDQTYAVLGDIHGLLAYPEKVMSLLEDMEPRVLLAGNHDKALFHHNEGHVNSDKLTRFELSHTMDNLSHEQEDSMRELPFMEVVTDSNSRICMTHAMPWPEKASGYEIGNSGIPKRNVPHFASIVGDDYDYVFHGHTHEQYSLDCEKFGHDVHFVNPGSLGYAGSYSVVDLAANEVNHKSVEEEYDYESVKEHVQSVLPEGAPHTNRWL